MFIDTVSDGIHPEVLNVRNHPSVSFKWKTSLLFNYFIHMLFNLIDGAWLPDFHNFNLIAVYVNLICVSLKCCMKVLIPMNTIHPINPCFSISLTAHDCLTHPGTPFDWINHLWSRRCSPLLPWYLSNQRLKTMEFEWNHSMAVLTRFQHEHEYFIVFHMKSR